MLAGVTVTSMLNCDVYLYAEVDRLIGLRAGTARRWINGTCGRTCRLTNGARSLAEAATLSQDDMGEPMIVELPADKDFPEIVINPSRYRDQPTFAGRRVSPVTIAEMADSGERREDLAADYGLSLRQVQDAIDYTKKYKLAALAA